MRFIFLLLSEGERLKYLTYTSYVFTVHHSSLFVFVAEWFVALDFEVEIHGFSF